MRKWIDALLCRLGYVPAPRPMTENEYVRAVTGGLIQTCELPWGDPIALQRIGNANSARLLDALARTLHPRVVITTDYQRGTPCS